MKLPTVRLTITPAEYFLLKPGLDLLANGLAGAAEGLFPHRHPWHRIDLQASDVYRDQAFNPGMAARIVSVRRKLWDLTKSRKVRLDAFEIAAAILALRLLKRSRPASEAPAEPEELKSLGKKLETYRNRAKRAAIAEVGKATHEAVSGTWVRFVAWCRYNLLQFSVRRKRHPYLRMLWLEQRTQLEKLITGTLQSRCYALPPDRSVEGLAKLMKESVRRGRAPMTLRELLGGDPRGGDFVFDFINRRVELRALTRGSSPQLEDGV